MTEPNREPHYSEAFQSAIAAYAVGDAAVRDDAVRLELVTRFGYALDFVTACTHYFPLAGRRFIEVGCGSGNVVTAAAALGATVAATDLMSECVDLTRQRLAEHGLEGDLFQSDIRSAVSPERTGAYDFVFCYQVLEHLPRKDQFGALANLFDMVAEGGFLFLDTENALCPYDRHDTQTWLFRFLRPEYQRRVVNALGKNIDYFEPSFGEKIDLHDYLTFDEVVGAAAVRGFSVINAFMPHRDGRQYLRVVTGSDWLHDTVLKYFPFERLCPISLLLRRGPSTD